MQSLKILDGVNSVDAKVSFQTPVTFTNSSDQNDEKNPHYINPKTGNTQLMSAVEHNNVEQVKELIQNGSSVNFYNNVTRQSCLKVAFDKRFITVLDLLLEHGAECNVYDYMYDIDHERLAVLLKHFQGKFVFPKRFYMNTFLLVMDYFQDKVDRVDLDSIWNIDDISPIAVKKLFKQVPDYKISDDCFKKFNEYTMRKLLTEVKSLSEDQVQHLSDKFPSLVVELYKENKLQLPPLNIKCLSLFLNDDSFEDFLYAFKEDLNQTFPYKGDLTQTLLGVALCYGGRQKNLCLLLVKCDPNQEFVHNNKWYTPLSCCCDTKRYDLVDMLLTCDTLQVDQENFRTTSLCPMFILNKEEMNLQNAYPCSSGLVVAVRDKLLKLGAKPYPKIADVDFINYMLPHEKYQNYRNNGRVKFETVKKYSLVSALVGVFSFVGFVVMKKRLV